ncbi:MAG: pyridoxine 5'-phosphate synthase [Phycisphaerae bacterium]
MPNLGVNIDHVATIRQARKTDEPDPVWAAVEAELGGADGITVHLREDRRHINDRDVVVLKHTVAVKLNLEMSINPRIVQIAGEIGPEQCTLVPEHRQEITTEGGLDVVRLRKNVGLAVKKLHQARCLVSAFIEPIDDQIKTSADLGFDAIELWTGGYSHTENPKTRQKALVELRKGVELGLKLGLTVHGGHGLTYRNIEPVARIPGFSEFNIGHTIVSRAVFVGLREAVRQMKELLKEFS